MIELSGPKALLAESSRRSATWHASLRERAVIGSRSSCGRRGWVWGCGAL